MLQGRQGVGVVGRLLQQNREIKSPPVLLQLVIQSKNLYDQHDVRYFVTLNEYCCLLSLFEVNVHVSVKRILLV